MFNLLKKIVNNTLGVFGVSLVKARKEINPFLFLKELNINTVIDVGANIGQFAGEVRKVLPNAQIYSFEPMKDCYEKLIENRKGDSLFKAFNFALGDSASESVIKKNDYAPSSSMLENSRMAEEAFPYTKNFTEEKIVVKTLDSVSSELSLKNKILLKIDVQGFEDKVLKGAEKFLNKTDVILVENSFFEIYKGQELFEQMYDRLYKLGFRYYGGVQSKRHPKTGEILFEDSLFIRKK